MTDQQNDRQTDMRAHEAVSLLITMGFIKFFMWGFRGRKKSLTSSCIARQLIETELIQFDLNTCFHLTRLEWGKIATIGDQLMRFPLSFSLAFLFFSLSIYLSFLYLTIPKFLSLCISLSLSLSLALSPFFCCILSPILLASIFCCKKFYVGGESYCDKISQEQENKKRIFS